MGKIFYIMGKSSSGKDTIYNRLRTDETLELSKLILYTTRPMREGEMQGREYHFVAGRTLLPAERRRKSNRVPNL